MAERERPCVVIVGAGFGGLWAARMLAKSPVDVLLIDRNNYHTFYPLLYQVGAAELEPEDIAYPIRSIFHKAPNVQFVLADVERIDFNSRVVYWGGHSSQYDYLILATGSAPHFFGIEGAPENTLPLRTLEQGVLVRNHILAQFEQAVHEQDSRRRQAMLTFVIVGGGPTGVEFSGALAELVFGPLRKDYPGLDFGEVRIVLLEAGDTVLHGMDEKLRRYAVKRLREMGVELRLGTVATKVTQEAIHLKDGGLIPTSTVVWTAGVRGSTVSGAPGMSTNKRGQVSVLPTLQLPHHPEVYVVGDSAFLEQDGKPLPMVAPVAMQEGAAGRNILRQVKGQAPEPFRYKDMGTLAVIGRNSAAAHLGRFNFTGVPAWWLWLGFHIFKLIGFRNRLTVLVNWAWAYLLYEGAIRLILPLPMRGAPAMPQPELRQKQETTVSPGPR